MTKESKIQVKKCHAGLKQKSGPVGVWSNYPVPLWLMSLHHVWVWQLSQVGCLLNIIQGHYQNDMYLIFNLIILSM
jgi:hypothetical protein